MSDAKPVINVTPLIDVLLVLLIIFMVVSPLKPSSFKAKVPQKPENVDGIKPHPDTLVVSLGADNSLRLNSENNLGTIENPEKLIEKLAWIFNERTKNAVYFEGAEMRSDLSHEEKIQKTVFIKAPRAIEYGNVAKLVDAVKTAGAHPIGLQIDDLE